MIEPEPVMEDTKQLSKQWVRDQLAAAAERVLAEMESGAMAAAGADEVTMTFRTDLRRVGLYRSFEVQVTFIRTEG